MRKTIEYAKNLAQDALRAAALAVCIVGFTAFGIIAWALAFGELLSTNIGSLGAGAFFGSMVLYRELREERARSIIVAKSVTIHVDGEERFGDIEAAARKAGA